MTWVCHCDRELSERDGTLECDVHGPATESDQVRWVTLLEERGAGP
jgi:hypothetical protein